MTTYLEKYGNSGDFPNKSPALVPAERELDFSALKCKMFNSTASLLCHVYKKHQLLSCSQTQLGSTFSEESSEFHSISFVSFLVFLSPHTQRTKIKYYIYFNQDWSVFRDTCIIYRNLNSSEERYTVLPN